MQIRNMYVCMYKKKKVVEMYLYANFSRWKCNLTCPKRQKLKVRNGTRKKCTLYIYVLTYYYVRLNM